MQTIYAISKNYLVSDLDVLIIVISDVHGTSEKFGKQIDHQLVDFVNSLASLHLRKHPFHVNYSALLRQIHSTVQRNWQDYVLWKLFLQNSQENQVLSCIFKSIFPLFRFNLALPIFFILQSTPSLIFAFYMMKGIYKFEMMLIFFLIHIFTFVSSICFS